MGSLIMHLCATERIRNKYKFSDKFILGMIMPDLLKLSGESADATHYIKEFVENSQVKRIPDILKFEQINEKTLKNEEELGYLSHLVQDKVWFDKYIGKYTSTDANNVDKVLYIEYGTTHSMKKFKKDIYLDYIYYNNYISKKYNLNILDIKSRMQNMIANPKLLEILDQNLDIQECDMERKNIFITDQDINDYINESVKKCCIEIDKIRKNV